MSVPHPRRSLGTNPWALLPLFVGVLLPLFTFGLLAEDVWLREGFSWDEPLLRAIHARATPTFDAVMIFFTNVGDPVPMIGFVALVFAILALRRHWGAALFFTLAAGGAAGLNVAAKMLFQRPRPALWPSLLPEYNYSFPSGHAMGSLAVVAALVILAWPTRWRWPLLIVGGFFVAAVGLARVYLGVHYPSDILAGWSASLAWVTGVRLILRLPWSRWWEQPNQAQSAPGAASKSADALADRTTTAGRAAR